MCLRKRATTARVGARRGGQRQGGARTPSCSAALAAMLAASPWRAVRNLRCGGPLRRPLQPRLCLRRKNRPQRTQGCALNFVGSRMLWGAWRTRRRRWRRRWFVSGMLRLKDDFDRVPLVQRRHFLTCGPSMLNARWSCALCRKLRLLRSRGLGAGSQHSRCSGPRAWTAAPPRGPSSARFWPFTSLRRARGSRRTRSWRQSGQQGPLRSRRGFASGSS